MVEFNEGFRPINPKESEKLLVSIHRRIGEFKKRVNELSIGLDLNFEITSLKKADSEKLEEALRILGPVITYIETLITFLQQSISELERLGKDPILLINSIKGTIFAIQKENDAYLETANNIKGILESRNIMKN